MSQPKCKIVPYCNFLKDFLFHVKMVFNFNFFFVSFLFTFLKVSDLAKEMTQHANNLNFIELITSENAKKFAARLHLLSLLAEVMEF